MTEYLLVALFSFALGYLGGRADLRDLGPLRRRWPQHRPRVIVLPKVKRQ